MQIPRPFMRIVVLAAVALTAACRDDGEPNPTPPQPMRFVQTWGAAAVYANAAATLPYFPSQVDQSTGIPIPGVAVLPALTPPANTTNTAAILANATVRQVFRASLAGTSARVRLSNAYGAADVTIDEAHIALADKAACQAPATPVPPATAARGTTCTNIVASTDTTLKVNGSPTFTIAKGQEIYTDAVPFTVPSLGDVAVSFYVRNQTVPLTTHSAGNQTGYIVVGLPGNTANYTASTAFDTRTIGGKAALATTTSILVVDGIDVLAPVGTRALVGFGDSITDGTNTVPDTSTRWTNQLAQRFAAQSLADGKPQVAVSNAGIGGNRLAADNPNAFQGVAGTTRFGKDALTRSGVTDVIVLEGINDIGQTATPTDAATLIAAYRELIRQAHAANVRIYLATLAPIRTDLATAGNAYGGLFSATAALFAIREPVRQQVNAWILASNEADGVFDFNAAVSAPGLLDQLYAPYNISFTSGTYDQLHPNANGYARIAGAVRLESFR